MVAALLIILCIVISGMSWLIFMPVNIKVDTDRNLYEVSQAGTLTVVLLPGETPVARIRILGLPIGPIGGEARKKEPSSRKVKPPARKSILAWMKLMSGVSNSFRLRKLECNVDLCDVLLNAQLFPLAFLISRGHVRIGINFQERYFLSLWIQAYLYRMIWAIIRFRFTK